MTKKQRELIYQKYGGRCAYTGRPLEPDWQVDHVVSHYLFGYTIMKDCVSREEYNKRKKEVNNMENLVPALRIVNHYKRSLDLEGFRRYMMDFHNRLARLPKKTKVERSAKRKEYIKKVADAFGITVDKPFGGLFYFETLTTPRG